MAYSVDSVVHVKALALDTVPSLVKSTLGDYGSAGGSGLVPEVICLTGSVDSAALTVPVLSNWALRATSLHYWVVSWITAAEHAIKGAMQRTYR